MSQLSNIEFYNCEEQVIVVERGEHRPLTEKDTEILQLMDERIKSEFTPETYDRLQELTKTSQHQPNYRRYRRVLMFLKCNFGKADTSEYDIDSKFNLRLEVVDCPLRGICANEGVICKPKLNTKFTEREKQIADMLDAGKDRGRIAYELGISTITVRNHIQSICAKINVHSESHLMQYITANKLNL